MKRNLLLIASSLLLAQGVYAQQIGIEQARSRAYEFGLKNSARKGHARGQQTGESATPELVYTCHNESDKRTCFYIFNLGNDEGYVVVGGDEVAKQILGYSESGSFDWETAPENEKWWLSQYQAEISAAMDLTEEERQCRAPRRGAATTTQERVDIPFMLTTKWNQSWPYNEKVNEEMKKCNNPGNWQTGCVATAGAQVMKYHQYPSVGEGEAYCKRDAYQLYADFSKSHYQWSLMMDDYGSNSTSSSSQQHAVALLMYDLGVATDMTYMSGQSGTSIKLLGYALIDNFKYDKSIENRFRIFHTDEEWENMIYNELQANRPVIYGGEGGMWGSHCFVCDGYRAEDNAFHFNWGWGASGNYYQISGTDIHFLYPNDQEALINVKRDCGGDYVPLLYGGSPLNLDGDHDFAMKLSYSGEKIMSYDYDHSDGSQSMYFTWKNCVGALTTQEIEKAIQATERTTGYTVYLCGKYRPSTTTGKKNWGYTIGMTSVEVELEELTMNGTYDMKPVSRLASKSGDDDWYDVALLPSVELPSVSVTNGITPGEVRDLSFSISGNWLTATSDPILISYPHNYKGKVTYTSSDPSVAIVSTEGEVIAVGEGHAEITVVGEDYINGVKIYNGVTQTFEIYVEKCWPWYYFNQYIYYTHTEPIILPYGYDGEVAYTSGDPNIFTVDADGTIHGVAPGESWIHVQAEETGLFYEIDDYVPIYIYRGMAEFYAEPYTRNDGNICEGESIYLPLVDHGSLYQGVEVYYRKTGSDYVESDYYEMDPEAKYLQELRFSSYQYDKTLTLEFYHDYLCTDPYNIPSMTITYRQKIQYAYTVPESGYGTLLLPFCADVPEGWEVFECPELNKQGNTAMLERSATIARNKPYIVKATPGATHTFVGPKAIDATSTTFTQGELKGAVIADKLALTTNDYVLDTRDGVTAFYRYQAGDDASAYCDVFRAVIHPETTTADVIYLQLPGPWGDVNGDDRVSVGDVATLVGHLKGNTPQPFVKGNADADKNGLIDKQDVEAVRNLIIKRVNP